MWSPRWLADRRLDLGGLDTEAGGGQIALTVAVDC